MRAPSPSTTVSEGGDDHASQPGSGGENRSAPGSTVGGGGGTGTGGRTTIKTGSEASPRVRLPQPGTYQYRYKGEKSEHSYAVAISVSKDRATVRREGSDGDGGTLVSSTIYAVQGDAIAIVEKVQEGKTSTRCTYDPALLQYRGTSVGTSWTASAKCDVEGLDATDEVSEKASATGQEDVTLGDGSVRRALVISRSTKRKVYNDTQQYQDVEESIREWYSVGTGLMLRTESTATFFLTHPKTGARAPTGTTSSTTLLAALS